MELLIVNLTTESFFRYSIKNNTDIGYNKILLELLTPPDKISTYSHWSREDNIKICPKHLHNYIEKKYNELYL
jgi:hypothetical protein